LNSPLRNKRAAATPPLSLASIAQPNGSVLGAEATEKNKNKNKIQK